MSRWYYVWPTFLIALVMALAALGWTSWTVLQLDRQTRQARATADLEENARLALWRIDTFLTVMIGQQSAQPNEAFAPTQPKTKSLRGKSLDTLAEQASGNSLTPWIVNPLASDHYLTLRFEVSPDGSANWSALGGRSADEPFRQLQELYECRGDILQQMISPPMDVRINEWNGSSEPIAGRTYLGSGFLFSSSDNERRRGRGSDRDVVPRESPAAGETRLEDQQKPSGTPGSDSQSRDRQAVAESVRGQVISGQVVAQPQAPMSVEAPAASEAVVPGQAPQSNELLDPAQQTLRSANEYAIRSQLQVLNRSIYGSTDTEVAGQNAAAPNHPFELGMLQPFWLNEQLMLVRLAPRNDGIYIQGCWVDWPELRDALLESMADLLPDAALVPAVQSSLEDRQYMSAALPVRLVPGTVASRQLKFWSPTALSLLAAWSFAILAAGAMTMLLWGVLGLSERRAAFVSAVTHELRTPLTTFRLYAEMLASGMVNDPAQREQYLRTLGTESDRLARLVENVLSYARLERGSATRRLETVTMNELIERVTPPLVERLAQCAMRLEQRIDATVAESQIRVDVAVVERILVNLVDNACKYAHQPGMPVEMTVLQQRRQALICLRDHGPGIALDMRKRLFRPFCKSAEEAAVTAPGVGLGLALSRRLASALGGTLDYELPESGGSLFVLSIPLAR